MPQNAVKRYEKKAAPAYSDGSVRNTCRFGPDSMEPYGHPSLDHCFGGSQRDWIFHIQAASNETFGERNIQKIRKGKTANADDLAKICGSLHYQPGDIMEYSEERSEEGGDIQ